MKELRAQVAHRLTELREIQFNGMSPEQVAAEVLDRWQIKIAPRTIRALENPKRCNPRLASLYELLAIYGTTIGDFFAFTSKKEHGVLVNDLLKTAEDEELRKALTTVLSRLRPHIKHNGRV